MNIVLVHLSFLINYLMRGTCLFNYSKVSWSPETYRGGKPAFLDIYGSLHEACDLNVFEVEKHLGKSQ